MHGRGVKNVELGGTAGDGISTSRGAILFPRLAVNSAGPCEHTAAFKIRFAALFGPDPVSKPFPTVTAGVATQ